MTLALLILMLPTAIAAVVMPVLVWPVQQLALLLIALVGWMSGWPHAQLLTGHPQPWVVLLVVLALTPWALPSLQRWRWKAFPLLLLATLVQAGVQLSDEVMLVQQWGRQWLLARHQGRAALMSSHGDLLSCQLAQQLGQGYGHRRLDWLVVMDPVAMTIWIVGRPWRIPCGGASRAASIAARSTPSKSRFDASSAAWSRQAMAVAREYTAPSLQAIRPWRFKVGKRW